jgi:hypothetical protein
MEMDNVGQDQGSAIESQQASPESASSTEGASLNQVVSSQGGASEGGLEAAQYTPNFKFKYTDSSKDETFEREFDDFVRGAIKDKDSEAKVRELYEKAYGLDYVKPKLNQTREQFRTLQTEHTELNQGLNELSQMLQRGDLENFFGALKIPQDKVFQYVLDKLNYAQLPPEQKRAYDEQNAMQSRAVMQERMMSQMQEQIQTQATQARTFELETAVSSPQVKTIADTYDARVGQPGAFKAEIIRRGQLAYYTTGEDIPVAQALNDTVTYVSRLLGMPGQADQSTTGAQGFQAAQSQSARPPVIPNLGSGRNVSTVAKQVRTLSDIESVYNEKFGR